MSLSEHDIEHLREHIAHYPHKRAGAIYCLYYVQDKYGYIPRDSLDEVSELTDLSPTQLDELITFYTLLRRRPVGRRLIRICDSISCYTRGAEQVLAAAKEAAGVEFGDISADGAVTVLPSICLGLCDRAPAGLVDDKEDLGELTPEKIRDLICKYAAETLSEKEAGSQQILAVLKNAD
ncbi:NADH-quinone oxidoreductase subunit NuoE [Pokkaliibacter sp. CJK22405]|uniref:NADH-quinone oxidoreductase subunit NuoE n=1 Tax=Pokkaliibacter sp. CJK22405 TaxID=3384615 RepID=UPI003984E6D5